MTGPAFERAGSPDPPPLRVAESSDVQPHGSAGLVNQGAPETVPLVAGVYGDLATASVDAAMGKRETDQSALNS